MARTKKLEEENTEPVQKPSVAENKKPAPKKKKRDWHKTAELLFAILVIIISMISLVYSIRTSNKTLELASKNNEFVERTLKRDLPAEFSVSFIPRGDYEIIKMQNVSKVEVESIILELKFYYILSNGKVFTRNSIVSALTSNENLLKKFQTANLIKYPKDINYLLGVTRHLPVGEIEPEGTRTFDDFPSITIENAIRISQLLGTELVARIRVDYKIKETKKQRTDVKFIWIHGYKPYQTVGRENLTREDLTTVVGGKKVIELLQTFEEKTKEVIFSEIENTDIIEETNNTN